MTKTIVFPCANCNHLASFLLDRNGIQTQIFYHWENKKGFETFSRSCKVSGCTCIKPLKPFEGVQ